MLQRVAALYDVHGDLPALGAVPGEVEREGGMRPVNAGSVGMPYADAPGAYWVLLGPGLELRRTVFTGAEQPLATREEAASHFESLAGG